MSDTPDYRPNVRLALNTISTKWNAQGFPIEFLLDASDADLVIDSLAEHGWSIIPTDIASAAREAVGSTTEVHDLTATLDSFGPRFVQLTDVDWVNPDHVAGVHEFASGGHSQHRATRITLGSGITAREVLVDEPAGEVIAKLTAPDPLSCSSVPGESSEEGK